MHFLSCWCHQLMEPTRLPTPSLRWTGCNKLCTGRLVQNRVTQKHVPNELYSVGKTNYARVELVICMELLQTSFESNNGCMYLHFWRMVLYIRRTTSSILCF